MLSLKNIGQRLLDSTTLDEKVGNFFRPKTGTLASTGRKWAQELAAKPAPSWVPQQVQQTAQNISDRGGFNRLKQEFTSNPAQFTPLSMKSAAVDTGRKLGSEDLGYGLRGALSLTPFQSAGKLTPKLSSIQQTTAPTTSRQQAAQSLGQTLYGTALTAPLSAGKTVLKSVGNVARNLAVGGTTGALMQGGSDLLTGNFSKESLKQGALSGLQNSWVLPVTNSLTDAAILKLFPKAGLKITGAGVTDPFKLGKIKEGFGRLLTQSLAQVPAENTAFTFLNQLDDKTKGSFTENWMNNLPGNIVGNILSAGVSGSVNVFSNPQSRKVVTDAMKKTVDEWNTPVTMMGGEKMPMWKYKMMYETKPGFARLDLGVGKDTPKLSVEPTTNNKFYINKYADNSGKNFKFEEVPGKKVDILPGVETFVHKNEGGGWTVTEARSGQMMTTGKTQAEAINKAREATKKMGNKVVMKYIEDKVKSNGLSPRFTQPSKPLSVEPVGGKDISKMSEKELDALIAQQEAGFKKNPIPQQKTVPPKRMDSLNPTGGLMVDYNPQSRMNMELGKNITTLDKTMKVSPDEMITIYRGAPKNQKGINPGDFVTTNPDLAKSYTGDGNVISLRVKAKDVLDDITEPLGDEYIYRPSNVAQGGLYDTPQQAFGGKKVLYHGTVLDNLESIARKGLTADKDLKSQTKKIYMSSDINDSLGYTSRRPGDKPLMLAIKDKAEYGPEISRGQKTDFMSTKTIPPEDIVVKVGDKWQSLKDYTKSLSPSQGGLSDVKPTIKGVTSTTKPRGLTTSVQEAPNINPTVKGMVDNSYTPKTNPELMGEARAMLSELPEGSKIDFKGVKNVDQKVAATIQEAINLQNAGDYKAAANLYNNLSEQGTELGRGVQAFSLLQKMTPEAISYSIASKIKKFNSLGKQQIPELNGEQTKLIADQVKVIDSLTGREKNIAINELEKTLNSFIPSSMLDKVAAVWKAGLLTSLRTHERNLIGNTIHGTMEVAKDYLASPVDALLGMKTGKRTLTATTQGLSSGVNRETGQQMVDMVKLGYDPSEQINKFDYKQITWADTPMQQFFKKYTDVVFRTLGASDKPFYNSALAHSLWNQAGAEAINAGQKGNKAFIENLVKNPTEEMMKTAISDANIATFKDKNAISGVANAIKNALSKNEWSKFGGEIVMPFTGVPSSVFSQIKNYSPIGLAQGIIKAGRVLAGQVPELQRQAAQEIGRGVIGTGIYGLGAYLMSKGLMTGQPEDAEEQRLWDLQNKPRNSVMVNGKWRSLNSLGPETFILLAGGKLQEELGQKDGSISNYAGTLGKDVLDQSFVQGIQAPVNAITDPARYAKSYVGNTISSVVPNVVKDSSKAFDSKQRETNSIMDYTKLGIPGLRNTLVEKRDSLGNVMKQEPTGFSAFVDVFNSKTPVKNQVTDELSRLQQAGAGYVPSKLTKNQTIAGVKKDLTPQELNQLEAKVGPELTAKMTALINSSGYQKLSDEDKATALQSITTSTRKIARAGGISGVTTSQTESTGKVYTLVNQETGSVKEVDLSKPIEVPEMTGNTELDKKLKSGYKSDITSRINDIVKLYEDGQIDAKTAEAQIIDLKTQSSKVAGGKKPKKITIKTTKAPRVSFKLAKPTKMSVIKAPTSKRARISFKNYKPAKIKV